MSILTKLLSIVFPSWFENPDPLTQESRKRTLEDEIILLAGDSGDGICRDAIHRCVDVWHPNKYDKYEIDECIDGLLETGHLLTDGKTFIDPYTLPNAARRIKDGWMLLSNKRIKDNQ